MVLDADRAENLHSNSNLNITIILIIFHPLGVPCFFMNGVKTFSGSRSVEEFIKMFEIIAQNYPQ